MLTSDVSAMCHAANAQLVIALPAVAHVDAGIRSMTGIAIRATDEIVARMDQIAAGIAASVEAQSVATREIMGHVRAAAVDPGTMPANAAAIHRALAETETVAANVVAAACMLCLEADRLRAEVSRLFDGVRAA
jgi:methyl-accepting chemotaxis protein